MVFNNSVSPEKAPPPRKVTTLTVRQAPSHAASFVLPEEEFAIYQTAKKNAQIAELGAEQIYVVVAASCFSFMSGFVNGCAMSGFGRGVEDVCTANGTLVTGADQRSITGFTGGFTESALLAGKGSYLAVGFEFAPIFSFLGGAFVCGLMVPDRNAFELGPMFGPLFLVGGTFASLAVVFAYIDNDERAPFYWLALNSGVSNGMTSIYSGGLIRSSNLTGPLTDIGVELGKLCRGKLKEAYKLRIRSLLAIMFWVGALSSWWATEAHQYKALIFNAVFFFVIGVSYMWYISRKHNLSVFDAALGRWDWGDALKEMGGGKRITEQELRELFRHFDADGSGTMDAREFSAALLTQCKRTVPLRMVEEMLESADVDGDGELDEGEFVKLMRNHVDVDNSGIAFTSQGISHLLDKSHKKKSASSKKKRRKEKDRKPSSTDLQLALDDGLSTMLDDDGIAARRQSEREG